MRSPLLLVALGLAAVSCTERRLELAAPVGHAESSIFRDGDDWEDDAGVHPQVIRITGPGGRCTAWLSSSNTLTTNAHCVGPGSNLVGYQYDTSQRNSSDAQFAALQSLGLSTGGFIHPLGAACPTSEDDCCWGGDLAVLVFAEANAVPRSVMKPLAIIANQSEEPECDGDDRCVAVIGTGRTDEDECDDDDVTNPLVDSGATRLYVESGLGDGDCPGNSDMLYGEYDFDDSSTCKGDSGAPVFWRGTDEVMAVNRGIGGDGGDDAVGPVLWGGGPNTARDFFFDKAGDQDHDTIQAAHDNCDRTPNLDQADWNANDIGDVCEDSDGDGLLDSLEFTLGTDPGDWDTDDDALSDGSEVNVYHTNPLVPDTDGDGLTDSVEVFTYGTNPLVPDTDGDALTDGAEVLTYGTDPLVPDTDGDALTDGAEVLTYGTNPLVPDTDGDGLTDGAEVLTHTTDPNDTDTDNDLLGDGFEVFHALDPLDADMDDDGVVDGKDTDWIEAALAAIPDLAFKTPGHQGAIASYLREIEKYTQRGNFKKALKLLNTLRKHLNGCGSEPDSTDWIVDCAMQTELRELLDLLGANLE